MKQREAAIQTIQDTFREEFDDPLGHLDNAQVRELAVELLETTEQCMKAITSEVEGLRDAIQGHPGDPDFGSGQER